MMWAALAISTALSAQGPLPYPLGPFADSKDAEAAASFERRVVSKGGAPAVLRAVCGEAPPQDPTRDQDEREDRKAIERLVARNWLIEHAVKTYPLLLEAIRKGGRAGASDAARRCGEEALSIVRGGICFGYELGGSGPELDRQPLALERRARASKALAGLLATPGWRQETALEVLAQEPAHCTGLPDAIRVATPTLVRLLGAPRPPVRIPVHPNSANAAWDLAFRALSHGGAERALAEKPVTAFLEHDASAPLAALAMARMGADARAALPRIGRVIEGIEVKDQAQLTQLGDAVDALVAIGKPARVALPSVVKLLSRAGEPGCRSLGGQRWAQLIRAIAGPDDAEPAAAALSAIVRCARDGGYGVAREVLETLGTLSAPGRAVLLSVLRDGTRTVGERREAAKQITAAGIRDLTPNDHTILSHLARRHERPWSQSRSPALRFRAALGTCREEGGRPARPAGGAGDEPPLQDTVFADCVEKYLCGPDGETYARTLDRCCQLAYRGDRPGHCDPAAK